jgi:hypothetical protein
MFDFADRDTGRAMVVTLWATKEAREASAEFAHDAAEKVVAAGGEQVISVREYEVGQYIFIDSFRTS